MHEKRHFSSTQPDVADVREGGTWSTWQRLKNNVLYGLARGFLFFAAAASRDDLRAFGAFLGRTVRVLAPRERRRGDENLARVFPNMSPEARASLLARCFEALGVQLGDVMATLTSKEDGPDDRLHVDARGTALLKSLHAEGRGIVLASAHLGNWERVGAALARIPMPVVAVGREAYDPRFDAWIERVRHRSGMETLSRGQRGAAFRIVRAIRSNKVLAIPMDLRSRVASRAVPFLGHPAETAIGPARLALRLGAHVVVATFEAGSVTVTKIETADLVADSAGELALTTRINDELSRRILASPTLWPWMHPRWDRGRADVDFERTLEREEDKLAP